MPRYIDADALIRLIGIDAICYKPYSRRDAIACIKAINTADVVPKSEVDWNSIPVDVSEALKQRAVEKAKSDVAREIFAEIEKLHLHITNDFDLRRYEQLKKKHTEETK